MEKSEGSHDHDHKQFSKVSTAAVLLLIVMFIFTLLECNYLPGFSRKKTSTAKNLGLTSIIFGGFCNCLSSADRRKLE